MSRKERRLEEQLAIAIVATITSELASAKKAGRNAVKKQCTFRQIWLRSDFGDIEVSIVVDTSKPDWKQRIDDASMYSRDEHGFQIPMTIIPNPFAKYGHARCPVCGKPVDSSGFHQNKRIILRKN